MPVVETRRTIQQVSRETGISIDTLRYYERLGLIPDVERAPNGHRRYSETNLTWIIFLKQLRETGMSLSQMQTFAQLRRQGDITSRQRWEMLEAHRREIEAQIKTRMAFLSVIDAKIARHKKIETKNPAGQGEFKNEPPEPMA